MALFPTTHWSLLAKASLDGKTESRKALEVLCRLYWGTVHEIEEEIAHLHRVLMDRGTLTINNALNWSGGTMTSPGRTVISAR